MIGERRIALGLGLVAGLTLGLGACAGGPQSHFAGGMPPAVAEMVQAALADRAKLRAFDVNADHEISSQELEAGLARQFSELDTNRDGVLKAGEVDAASKQLKAEDVAMPLLRDWNQSGGIEFEEFAAWNRGRFRRTDSDQDGTVTKAELTAMPKLPKRPSGGPPGGMPPGGKPPGGGQMPGGRLSQSVANQASGGF